MFSGPFRSARADMHGRAGASTANGGENVVDPRVRVTFLWQGGAWRSKRKAYCATELPDSAFASSISGSFLASSGCGSCLA